MSADDALSPVLGGNLDPEIQFRQGEKFYLGEGVPTDFEAAFDWYSKAAGQGYAPAQFAVGWLYYALHLRWRHRDYVAAASWFRKAADQGFPPAQYELGVIYRLGLGVKADERAASEWYRLAAQNGHPDAAFWLDDEVERICPIVVNDHELEWLRTAASDGCASSQFRLGELYLDERSPLFDLTIGMAWISKAAAKGDADAQLLLGEKCRGAYLHDALLGKSESAQTLLTMAIEWFSKAASQGRADAQCALGDLTADRVAAAAWYLQAASQGHEAAKRQLCVPREDYGRGPLKNVRNKLDWLMHAADIGYADAQYQLGREYVSGDLPFDTQEASRLFELAAMMGHEFAQLNIGVAYRLGSGVLRNPCLAEEWLFRAAKMGNRYAQTFLGEMYSRGEGVPIDKDYASMWFKMAAGRMSAPGNRDRDLEVWGR